MNLLRRLSRSPITTLASLLTLALGIGAATAVFTVVHGVLWSPLPFAEPDRLTMVWLDNRVQGWPEDLTSWPNYEDWKRGADSLEAMAPYVPVELGVADAAGTLTPERLPAALVGPDFFEVLGVQPLFGRDFRPEEGELGNNAVVILGHDLWNRRFGGDPDIVGTAIQVDGEAHRVVGIAPAEVEFPLGAQLWAPLAPEERIREARGYLWLHVIGRLTPGVTFEGAQAQVDTVASALAAEHPDINSEYGITLEPFEEHLVGDVRRSLLVLAVSVLVLLAIACVNVASLALVQARRRERELAMRAALGASSSRLFLQVLGESLALSLAGGLAGLLLAAWGTRLLLALAPAALPRASQVGLDPWAFLFALGVALVTGVAFGMAPALASARPQLAALIKEGSGAGEGRSGLTLGRALVVAEVALAVVLLVGAGLLARSFERLQNVDQGFEPGGVTALRLDVPEAQYPEPAQVSNFYRQLFERLEALPAVGSVAGVSALYTGEGFMSATFSIEGRPAFEPDEQIEVSLISATPNLFRSLGVPLLEGRDFAPRDGEEGAAPTVIINRAMADLWWSGESPLGQRIKYGQPDDATPWMEIIGVVGSLRTSGPAEEARPATYVPYFSRPRRSLLVTVKASTGGAAGPASPGDQRRAAEALVPAVRDVVRSLDARLPIATLAPLEDLAAERTARERFSLVLLGVFAIAALILAILGVYGVLAYTVARSSREIGVRMALGAHRQTVLRTVVGRGLRLALIGITLGLIISLLTSHTLDDLLFETSTGDPLVLGGVALTLLLVALAASFLPARRATRVDPAITLRED